jgi:GT2 family glycosyltransferase
MSGALDLTVAVAACERPAALARCLDGILAGTLLPAELIVVDQSAHDEVAGVVARYRPEKISLIYLRQPRRGLSASRNAALARARRGLIAFTDDDCVPAPEWLAAATAPLAGDTPVAAVTGRMLPLGEARPGTHAVSPRAAPDRAEYRGRAIPWVVGTGGNIVVRRDWLERLGGFDERLGVGSPGRAAEDADLLYRLLRAGATIRYEPGALVYHERQTETQRLSSRASYGFGIGAMCGLWLRRRDPYAARLLGAWLAKQSASLVGASFRGDWFLARQRMLSLKGGALGLRYGLSLAP